MRKNEQELTKTPAPGVLWSQVFGSGPRTGLAIHCSLARSGEWRGVAGALVTPLALTAIDLPGHGRSPDWDGAGDYIALATLQVAEVAATLADADEEGQIDLIGHSGGGVVALGVALAMPEAIRTLTLVEPVLFAAARGFPEWDAHVVESEILMRALTGGDDAAAARAFTDIWGAGQPWDTLDDRSRSYFTERVPLVTASEPGLGGDSGRLLAPGRIETLEMPAMIITGTQSPPIVHRIAEEIAARLPDVGLAEVPGAGHMLPITHAAQVAGLIDVNLDRD